MYRYILYLLEYSLKNNKPIYEVEKNFSKNFKVAKIYKFIVTSLDDEYVEYKIISIYQAVKGEDETIEVFNKPIPVKCKLDGFIHANRQMFMYFYEIVCASINKY